MRTPLARPALAAVGALALATSVSACNLLGGQVPTAEVGECMVLADLPEQIDEIPTVDCSEEHDAQIYEVFDLADADSYPGDEAVVEEADPRCIEAFESFVGTDVASTSLGYDFIPPSQESWEQANDREVLCVAFLQDGSTATESWEGSGL